MACHELDELLNSIPTETIERKITELLEIGSTLAKKEDFWNSAICFQKCIFVYDKLNKTNTEDFSGVLENFSVMRYDEANTYKQMNPKKASALFSTALDYLLLAEDTLKKIHGENSCFAEIENAKGAIYLGKGEFVKSLESYKKVEYIRQQKNDEKSLADVYFNIGNVYKESKVWEMADRYYQRKNSFEKRFQKTQKIQKS